MVDLGFLLITFFIFTTTLSSPKAMRIFLPKDVPDPIKQKQPESAVLTLMPSAGDRLFYYEGGDPSRLQSAPFPAIREIIRNKQIRTNAGLMLVLKPTPGASYRNIVDMLDEISINRVKKYAFTDISPEEYRFIQEREKDQKE
jgi:biopolymer transport protein ExbD